VFQKVKEKNKLFRLPRPSFLQPTTYLLIKEMLGCGCEGNQVSYLLGSPPACEEEKGF
jgi:hypothetical protein